MSENASMRMSLPSDQESSGRTFDQAELESLKKVLDSGTLTSTKGEAVKSLERRFAELLGVKHAFACASGTAAVHCAVAAVDPEPGDEIITTPITDMGALAPILYQGAIPVFADVDPETCNVTAETIEPCISDRTRAIIVTHLFGNPCEMQGILELADRCQVPVIEDCAQAFLARNNGSLVGTLGKVGCFSLQQGKHITAGEGGLVTTSDDRLARRMYLFINKAWGYGDEKPDHYFLALNYRMSELLGAVALSQLDKLKWVVDVRRSLADRLTRALKNLPGVVTPKVCEGSEHVFWKYCIMVDPAVVPGGVVEMGKVLKERGIFAAPRYIQKPAFMCEVFQKQNTFGKSRYPFTLARPEALNYDQSRFPGTYTALDRVLVIPWNERYTEDHVDYIAAAIHDAVKELTGRRL